MIFKILWAIRALIYKPFFGKFRFPSYIGKPTFIKNSAQIYIDKNVRIYPHSRIECISSMAKVIINENVTIGHSLHLTAHSILEVSKNCIISSNVLITDNRHDYRDVDKNILDQKLIIKKTFLGENCFIGKGAVIDAGTQLGRHCVVGANSVLSGVYPDYSVIVGAPGKIIKRYDKAIKKWRVTNELGNFE